MHNWSVDIDKLADSPEQLEQFRLEQLINFGLGNEKISRQRLTKLLPKLHLDQAKKRYLEFLLQA